MRAAIAGVVLATLALGTGVAFADRRGEWEELGRRSVQGRDDVDTIHVGRREGKFTTLKIAVEGGDLELWDFVVTFSNGETFRPAMRHRFREGTRSRTIDLPGNRRSIQSITFRYGNAGRRGDQAHVIVLSGGLFKQAGRVGSMSERVLGER